eukprot:5428308-Pyramimonas_sp.AAC.1
MLCQAQPAPTMVSKLHFATMSKEELLSSAGPRNERLLGRVRPCADAVLGAAAWEKTTEEVKLGLVSEPVYSMEELPFPRFCLVRRHGLWESHGGQGV